MFYTCYFNLEEYGFNKEIKLDKIYDCSLPSTDFKDFNGTLSGMQAFTSPERNILGW